MAGIKDSLEMAASHGRDQRKDSLVLFMEAETGQKAVAMQWKA